jgi:S1-C subfamily serine protease
MKRLLIFVVVPLFLVVFAFGGPGYAKIYKYKDEKGVWRYTDAPVTDEQASESMAESNAAAKPASRNLASQLLTKMAPKNEIEQATMATLGIQTPAGFGSGFFVNDEGYIITNKHVLRGSEQENQKTEQDYQKVKAEIQKARAAIREKEAQIQSAELKLEIYKASLDEEDDHKVRWAGEKKYNIVLSEILKWKDALDQERQNLAALEESINESKDEFNFGVSNAEVAHHFTIFLADNTELYVNLVKVSDQWDLALLKLDGYQTPFIETLNSNQMAQGERVYAIGNPIKLKNSVASGVLSGHERGFVKTDAQIYPGNSGGPLVTADGRVIGINTMKMLTRNFEGLGFAIPIETALSEFQAYLGNN